MNKKQKGLGKGIDAILPFSAKFSEIAIADIQATRSIEAVYVAGNAVTR